MTGSKIRTPFITALFACAILGLVGCSTVGKNFNESKVDKIKVGVTTEKDIVQMFGEPQDRSRDASGMLTYTYSYMESWANPVPFASSPSKFKSLIVFFGSNGKVKNYSVNTHDTDVRTP